MVCNLIFYSFPCPCLRIISSAISMFWFSRSMQLRSSHMWSRISRSTLAISRSRRFLLKGSFSLSSLYLKYLRSCSNLSILSLSLSIIQIQRIRSKSIWKIKEQCKDWTEKYNDKVLYWKLYCKFNPVIITKWYIGDTMFENYGWNIICIMHNLWWIIYIYKIIFKIKNTHILKPNHQLKWRLMLWSVLTRLKPAL